MSLTWKQSLWWALIVLIVGVFALMTDKTLIGAFFMFGAGVFMRDAEQGYIRGAKP
jgi:hypothetical protein